MRTKSDPEFFHVFKAGPSSSVTAEQIGRAELLAWAANQRPGESEVEIVGSDGIRYRLREVWELERVDAPEQKPAHPAKKRGRKSKAEKAAAKNQTEGYAQVIKEQGRERSRVSIRDTDGKPISGSGEAVQS